MKQFLVSLETNDPNVLHSYRLVHPEFSNLSEYECEKIKIPHADGNIIRLLDLFLAINLKNAEPGYEIVTGDYETPKIPDSIPKFIIPLEPMYTFTGPIKRNHFTVSDNISIANTSNSDFKIVESIPEPTNWANVIIVIWIAISIMLCIA